MSRPAMYGGGPASSKKAAKYRNGKHLEHGDKSTGPTVKYHRRQRSKLCHKKQHRPQKPVFEMQFAPWIDGDYYPLKKAISLRPSKTEVHFMDGNKACVWSREVVEASRLYAGAMVGLYHSRSREYTLGLVLEYCKDTDRIMCATQYNVERYHTKHLMLPSSTAEHMLKCSTGNFEPMILCTYLTSSRPYMTLTLTTSDLAELRQDGWINEVLVELYLR